ncbi:MAG: aminotransferase class I/II-fold pyridoxal phosphate-dependent enzyme [Candidatus Obscuribacterales bacterium]|nr:aminotransferase class I/II-fold pyridoxal phosphate-dependent enzyme [Candidatus Obscuribacterales bacterium]
MESENSVSHPALSRTVLELPPSGIRRFFDIAAAMQDVVSLGVGEPDFATPWSIREAAIYSIERGQTTYTSNYGLLELRRAISKHLMRLYEVEYNPDTEILVTVGVSEALDLAMRSILDPGDEVIVPEPSYVSYKPCISLAGGQPVVVETKAEDGFAVTVEALEKHCSKKTKAIILGYPSNPTGGCMSAEQLQKIVDFARLKNLFLISDEIYDRLVYEGTHCCVASLPGAYERTLVLNGFSKAYAMTGWRVGYACGPAALISAMMKIHAYTMLCAPTAGQKAALEALNHAENSVREMLEQYNQRRLLIVNGFNEMGLSCHIPKGAFYAFPSIASSGLSSEAFAEKLLYDQRVAVVPGTAFGAAGSSFIRCSYATSLSNINLALERIAVFLAKIRC